MTISIIIKPLIYNLNNVLFSFKNILFLITTFILQVLNGNYLDFVGLTALLFMDISFTMQYY